MKKYRICSLVVSSLLLLTLFFSMIFISEEMGHHDCSGENCPVCAVLEICINNVEKCGTVVIAAAVAAVIMITFSNVDNNYKEEIVFSSLTGKKVRLNN
ncbi:hypothetical protein SAMN06297422_1373 [Lachnospiraceae bacterium]|nr:hypothetical protein SAMN06297422_1373 [Lachnospiraceae bacterium]